MDDIRAKKSLGQNFLSAAPILSAIVEAGDVQPGDFVLEVGPGKGSLTEKLLIAGATVCAVEKDDRLIDPIRGKLGDNSHFSLIHKDILEALDDPLFREKLPETYKIIANLPYYITGTFLERVFSLEKPPAVMVLMLQKEVAERIVARDGKESILSMSVKAYGEPKYIKTVDAHYFTPKPKVDSAIIRVSAISKNFFTENELSEQSFFTVLKRGFAHKRKMLRGNLETTDEMLKKCDIPANARAENLTKEKWACLARTISTENQ